MTISDSQRQELRMGLQQSLGEEVARLLMDSLPDDYARTVARLDETVRDIRHDLSRIEQKMDARFDVIDDRFTAIDTRFAGIDDRFAAVNMRLDSIDNRFALIDDRFTVIDTRFTAIDDRFAAVNMRLDTIDGRLSFLDGRMKLMVGTTMAFGSGIIALLVQLVLSSPTT